MLNLRSNIIVKLLGYYFLNPKEKKYVNELAKILGVDAGNLDRKLKELEKEGILISESKGYQKYYFLNTNYPLLNEVKKIYNAKYGLKERFAAILKKLKGLEEAYFFGSYAKDALQQESDIDVLLIGEHSSFEAKKLLLDLEKELQREINIINLTRKEFLERKKKRDEFIKNIFSEKIIKII